MAAKLAGADGLVAFGWSMAAASLGPASLILANVLDWKGDKTPLVYGIILILNFIFVELSVALGGATWNPTVPLALRVAGLAEDTLAFIAMRTLSMAIGAALGVWALHQAMPAMYGPFIGSGPSLQVAVHQGALVEGLLTFLLTLVLLYTLRGTKNRFLQTPIIVSCALTLVTFGADYTGPAMNPTDAFGWAFFHSRHKTMEHLYVYWLTPLMGTILAASLCRYFTASQSPVVQSEDQQKLE